MTKRGAEPLTCATCGKSFYRPPSRSESMYCSKQCYGDAKLKTADTFWERVQIGPPDKCWPWLGAKTKRGYGHLMFQRELQYAHRVAWALTHGPIGGNLFVLHHCDVMLCCNPNHLHLGTHKDNMQEAVARNRFSHAPRTWVPGGEDHPKSSLTNAQAAEIRHLYEQGGVSQKALSKRFGVSTMTVNRVILGKRYKGARP